MKFTGIESKKYWIEYLHPRERNFMKGWNKRENHIAVRGYCIVTKETLSTLLSILHKHKVLDAGAGTGYLTYQLKKQGIDIEGVVKNKKTYTFKRNFMTKRLMRNDYTTMDISQYNAFILSWPDYDGEQAAAFLHRLKPGDKLIYQGESQGGCCATDEFFDILEKDFVLLEKETNELDKNHVTFFAIHDFWSVYIKK